MPLPRHAHGRPGTAVIPDDWQTTHAPVLATTRKATVNLRRGRTTRTPAAPYATAQMARIQALVAGGTDAEVVGETIYVRGYLVTLDVMQAAEVTDLVDVTACPDDPTLEGKTLTVGGVVRGSLLFERDLFCTLDN